MDKKKEVITFRCPGSLKEKIRQRADENYQTINAYLTYLILNDLENGHTNLLNSGSIPKTTKSNNPKSEEEFLKKLKHNF